MSELTRIEHLPVDWGGALGPSGHHMDASGSQAIDTNTCPTIGHVILSIYLGSRPCARCSWGGCANACYELYLCIQLRMCAPGCECISWGASRAPPAEHGISPEKERSGLGFGRDSVVPAPIMVCGADLAWCRSGCLGSPPSPSKAWRIRQSPRLRSCMTYGPNGSLP